MIVKSSINFILFISVFFAKVAHSWFSSTAYTAYIHLENNGDTLEEGDNLTFKVGVSGSQTRTCSLTYIDQTAVFGTDYTLSATLNNQPIADLNNFQQPHNVDAIVTLTAMADGDTSSETLRVTFTCGSKSAVRIFKINPPPSGNGDPHFEQNVFDSRNKKMAKICYDVTGKSGQLIEVLTDKRKSLKVYGELKDDYYMHKFIVKYYFQHLEVTTNQITINSEFKISWQELSEKNWMKLSNYRIILKRKNMTEMVLIDLNDNFLIGIKRNRDFFGKLYLDILFFGLKTYKGKEGLIGNIGNNQIQILEPVQSSTIETLTLIVNGERTIGHKINRRSEPCYLFNVNSLLFPKKILVYVKEKIKP